MGWRIFGGRKSDRDLRTRCQQYLEKGPPTHMTDYVPGSVTEIIIAHGAEGKRLGAELSELAEIALLELNNLRESSDPEIGAYMLEGKSLVREVLGAYGAAPAR